VPLVLGPDKLKLSKRRGAVDVLAYRDQGYLPGAVVNAMALLGWSSPDGKEVLTPDELVARFSLERVQSSPAVYDPKRLDSLNGLHIRLLSPTALADALEPWLPGAERARILELVPLLQERLPRLDAAPGLAAPLLGDPPWPDGVTWPPEKVDADTAAALLDATVKEVEDGALDDVDALRERLGGLLEERGLKPRVGFLVLYVAVLRSPQGVPVFQAMQVLGRERTLVRLHDARARLGVVG
jgi:glutamyl-tRNA synthetase